MKLSRTYFIILALGAMSLTQAAPVSAAGTVVKVSLWDTGPNSMDMLGKGVWAMGVPQTNKSKPTMGINAVPNEIPAGEVTFDVTNNSKDVVHEMVLAPVKDTEKPLPYDKTIEKVNEDAAGHLGEVAELEPKKSGSLKVTLKPGKYILYCNIPGHYVLGMWTLVTVKP